MIDFFNITCQALVEDLATVKCCFEVFFTYPANFIMLDDVNYFVRRARASPKIHVDRTAACSLAGTCVS